MAATQSDEGCRDMVEGEAVSKVLGRLMQKYTLMDKRWRHKRLIYHGICAVATTCPKNRGSNVSRAVIVDVPSSAEIVGKRC